MFDLDTPEQATFRDTVRKLAQTEIPRYLQSQDFPRELFRTFAQNGLTGVNIPTSLGGIEVDSVTRALIIEEIAACDLGPAIFLSVHNMVAGLLTRHASETQKKKYLPELANGNLLGAFALSEPGAGSDAAALSTTAKKDGDSFCLNGSKCWITSAGEADIYLVFVKTDDALPSESISAFLVEKDRKGVSIGPPEKKMGCELSPIASVFFDNVLVPAENLVGTLNDGYRIALSGLAGGRVNIAAAANGLSRTALRLATEHLSNRKQFNTSLIDFQGLQFMLADMKMKLEAGLLLTWRAARLLDENNSSAARMYPSLAKCFATDSAMQVTTDAVQLMGAMGYIKETGAEKLMRDAKMLQIVEGTNQIQRIIIARELKKQ